jgi:hypothetical protein
VNVVSADHPKQTLLFFIVSDLDDDIRASMRAFVRRVAASGHWTIAPPHHVESREEPQDTSRGDMAIETVGGYLELYTALPPWTLPRDIDLQHLHEVEGLVNELREFSRGKKLEIEFELDGKFVGSIVEGEMDRSLSVGLLGEWRRLLESDNR